MQLAVPMLRLSSSTQAAGKRQAGFTLVELLVVISIISVLSGLILVNVVGLRERGADTRRKNDLRQLKTALRLYYNDYQQYPAGSGTITGCGVSPTFSACGTQFSAQRAAGAEAVVYMSQLPPEYLYYSAGGDTFVIQVDLQNASDADIAASQTKCDPSARAYYGGTLDAGASYFVCED